MSVFTRGDILATVAVYRSLDKLLETVTITEIEQVFCIRVGADHNLKNNAAMFDYLCREADTLLTQVFNDYYRRQEEE